MKQKKAFYQQLNYSGYTWRGYWDGLHHFCQPKEGGGYWYIKANEQDIEDGNIVDMVKFGVSR